MGDINLAGEKKIFVGKHFLLSIDVFLCTSYSAIRFKENNNLKNKVLQTRPDAAGLACILLRPTEVAKCAKPDRTAQSKT